MNEHSASKPINPAAAFALGIFGFFAFAALAFVAYYFFRDGFTSEAATADTQARLEARAAVAEANAASIHSVSWVDEEKEIVSPTIDAYLPIAADKLLDKKPTPFVAPAQ